MKIAFFEVFDSELQIFKELLPGNDVLCLKEKLNKETVAKAQGAEIVSVFVNSEVSKDIIDQLPALKLIATRTTGFDHIDCQYAAEKGIAISNVPAYGSNTVAEFTFALILNLSRKVYRAYNQLKEKGDFSVAPFEGFDLAGKTIGILGTGRIGKNVAKIGRGFGMRVIAYDLHPDLAFAKENGFEYKNFDEVISSSDILTLHVPYSKENYHLINKENIAKMKKGVYLINTARGELVDTDALLWGLKEKIIAGAGLDVLESERKLKEEFTMLANASEEEKKDYKTLLEDHALIDMPNVIVTPHIAFYSKEAEAGIVKVTVENIRSYTEGRPLNLVK